MIARRFLFAISELPYDGCDAQEGIDLILSAAAFDQSVSLLFLDDGVFQLHKNQSPQKPGPKQLAPAFGTFELYGVQDVWVEAESLLERGMSPEDLVIPVTEISRDGVSELLGTHEIVVSI
jgi:tRNA 2-thiouridine synthesizing protein C